MPHPTLHTLAPDFTAPVIGGSYKPGDTLTLSHLRGQGHKVVLYFYPKDDTPGCTTQACALRDAWTQISSKAHLFGISPDPIKKHAKFIQKYQLPFPLIADDEAHTIATAYGVWVQKQLYGRTYMGVERTTFIIGEDGRITTILEKVKPAEHLEKVLSALAS
ncbi:peroxiredoxin [Prosthecobacter sp.]|uniref:peroxiredoxin n=1 Tax=Prosthecobacter sp. TaxID=1965333 RepID=UPI003783171A